MGVESASPPHRQSAAVSELDQSTADRVLLLEKDAGLRKIIQLALRQLGLQVFAAGDFAQAQRILDTKPPELFILALDHQGDAINDLVELYRQKKAGAPNALLLMTTRRIDDQWRNHYQPEAVIYKPFDIRFLIRRVKELTQKKELKPANCITE